MRLQCRKSCDRRHQVHRRWRCKIVAAQFERFHTMPRETRAPYLRGFFCDDGFRRMMPTQAPGAASKSRSHNEERLRSKPKPHPQIRWSVIPPPPNRSETKKSEAAEAAGRGFGDGGGDKLNCIYSARREPINTPW